MIKKKYNFNKKIYFENNFFQELVLINYSHLVSHQQIFIKIAQLKPENPKSHNCNI